MISKQHSQTGIISSKVVLAGSEQPSWGDGNGPRSSGPIQSILSTTAGCCTRNTTRPSHLNCNWSQAEQVSTNNVKKEYPLSKRPVQRQNSRSLLGKDRSSVFPQHKRHLRVSSFLRMSGSALHESEGSVCYC